MISDYAELVIEASNRIGDGALVKRADMIVGFAEAELRKAFWNYQALPSLIDTDSNWLLESDPEIYLFAFIKHAYLAMMDAENALQADRYLAVLIERHKADRKNLTMEGQPFVFPGVNP